MFVVEYVYVCQPKLLHSKFIHSVPKKFQFLLDILSCAPSLLQPQMLHSKFIHNVPKNFKFVLNILSCVC